MDHPHDPANLPLTPPMNAESRGRLIDQTASAIASRTPRLDAASAEALDRLVESGWSSQLTPPLLRAIAPPRPERRLAETTIAALEAEETRNPFRLPLPTPAAASGHDAEPDVPHSFRIARIGALAAGLILAAVLFIPALQPEWTGDTPAGANLTSPPAAPQADRAAPEDREDPDADDETKAHPPRRR